MKTIVNWLIAMEYSASKLYSEAADFFHEDKELVSFLTHISADEADHYHFMTRAAHYLESQPHRKSQIEVDDAIKAKIEAPIRTSMELLHAGILSKESLIDCVVQSELSEWNDLFQYVVNTLKGEEKIFERAASRVQHHMRHIEHFLNTTEYGNNRLQAFTKLPYTKKEKILIVDDEAAIAELLAALLEDFGEIDLSANGMEALERIKNNNYDLVISDLDMPFMNGIELYNQARSYFIKANDVFIFHTGNLTSDHRSFFEENKLAFMEKPSSIMQIRKSVAQLFHQY